MTELYRQPDSFVALPEVLPPQFPDKDLKRSEIRKVTRVHFLQFVPARLQDRVVFESDLDGR